MTVHPALPGASITALCATPSGNLLAATSDGHLTVISVTTSSETAGAPEGRTPRELVTAFLEGTNDAPPDGRLEDLLVLTDGERTWDQDDLETVTSTTSADPSWLQIQAAMNAYKQNKGNEGFRPLRTPTGTPHRYQKGPPHSPAERPDSPGQR
ncbi:MAG: hypothetical protein M3Z75_00465 [Actinomycetota bacterium]|nr:hypothetical protein [Actinomycetota bacterium]